MPQRLLSSLVFLATQAVSLSLAGPTRAAEAVTSCSTDVIDGYLEADLDCTAFEIGVRLADRGTLDLAGHTLTPGDTTGVMCMGNCTIVGSGGRISGGDRMAISMFPNARGTIRVSDVEISNNIAGIDGDVVRVTNSSILDNWTSGVRAGRRIYFSGSTVSGSTYAGLDAGLSVAVADSTISSNTRGVLAGRRIQVENSSVTASGEIGASGWRVALRDSAITGSGAACGPDPALCYDVGSAGRPRVQNSTCGESVRLSRDDGAPTIENWGVCAGD